MRRSSDKAEARWRERGAHGATAGRWPRRRFVRSIVHAAKQAFRLPAAALCDRMRKAQGKRIPSPFKKSVTDHTAVAGHCKHNSHNSKTIQEIFLGWVR